MVAILTMTNHATPGRNGAAPGCSGDGCHIRKPGNIVVTKVDSLTLEIKVQDSNIGKAVSGELVNLSGIVVSTVSKTNNNPFRITAPSPGSYVVYAGNRNPSNSWDSVSVTIEEVSSIVDFTDNDLSVLRQNYPNPVQSISSIHFYLNAPGQTRLLIYNGSGKLVKVIIDDYLSLGNHIVIIRADDYAKGLYYYQLITSNKNILTRNLLIE